MHCGERRAPVQVEAVVAHLAHLEEDLLLVLLGHELDVLDLVRLRVAGVRARARVRVRARARVRVRVRARARARVVVRVRVRASVRVSVK